MHATAFGLAVMMGIYNAAAWVLRREPHLAVNRVLYAALIAWEQKHATRHLLELQQSREIAPAVAAAVPKKTSKPTKVAAELPPPEMFSGDPRIRLKAHTAD